MSRRAATLADASLLALFCAIAMRLKWLKLFSLVSWDPAWWMYEAMRFARGEVPYRDFYWPYGPLTIAVLGYPLRWFAVRFDVMQWVMNGLSLILVAQFYWLARRILPGFLRLAACGLFIAVCITTQAYFSLFSLISYEPAVQVAAIGLFLVLIGVDRYLVSGRATRGTLAMIAAGVWIAWLAKQEPLLATVCLWVLLLAFDPWRPADAAGRKRWFRSYIGVAALSFVPPACAYLGLGLVAGWPKLLNCLEGFGLATTACAWWPNGYGVFGALAAAGVAVILLAIAAIVDRRVWRARLGSRYGLLLMAAVCAAAIYIGFEWPAYSDLLVGPGSLNDRIARRGPELLSSSSFLRPVLWTAIPYLVYLGIQGLRHRFSLSVPQARAAVLLLVPAAMSVRSLFGTSIAPNLEVPAISYPFLLLLVPYLLWKAVGFAGTRAAAVFVLTVVIGYSAVRLVGGYHLLADAPYPLLETAAGPVRLHEKATEGPIYQYVMANTSPSDALLELPFAGGITFASGRQASLFSTVFVYVKPPRFIQQEDLERIKRKPPALVIASGDEHLGTTFGIKADVGCVFPALLWKSNRPGWDPDYALPVTRFVEAHDREVFRSGSWRVLRPVR